jgi:general secretion pathway protein E
VTVERIGEILEGLGEISRSDTEQALVMQRETGALFGQALLKLGSVAEEPLLQALSAQLSVPLLDAAGFVEAMNAGLGTERELNLPVRWLKGMDAFVWANSGAGQPDEICVAALNPLHPELTDKIYRSLGASRFAGAASPARAVFFMASRSQIDQLKARYDLISDGADQMLDGADPERLREMAEQAPVIDFVNTVFSQSLAAGASDIHIEPYEHAFEVRLRIDGVLRTWGSHPKSRFNAVASRIKLMSGMDIAEQRLPQDGRQSIRFAGEALDLRVSSLPGAWGESLVLRLLRKARGLPDLQGLGLDGRQREALTAALRHPNGVIIVTGPTGSGKSTTLYRIIDELNDGQRKIITVEDPVEYNMPGITQVQVKADIGYSFARSLRAILRHDPDVVMVGEVRDPETAQICAQASLTGHLVLTTLHTNSAIAAIERLMDLGLEPFLIATSLRALAAQRLVRKVCQACSEEASPMLGRQMLARAEQAGSLIRPYLTGPERWRTARGCPACGNSGYKGRLGLFEVATITDSLQEGIARREPTHQLEARARSEGFVNMLEDGLIRAWKGETTLDEVLRVVGAEFETET